MKDSTWVPLCWTWHISDLRYFKYTIRYIPVPNSSEHVCQIFLLLKSVKFQVWSIGMHLAKVCIVLRKDKLPRFLKFSTVPHQIAGESCPSFSLDFFSSFTCKNNNAGNTVICRRWLCDAPASWCWTSCSEGVMVEDDCGCCYCQVNASWRNYNSSKLFRPLFFIFLSQGKYIYLYRNWATYDAANLTSFSYTFCTWQVNLKLIRIVL